MAVAHTILVIIYHVLMDRTFYEELLHYTRQDARQEAWEKKRALAALEGLATT